MARAYKKWDTESFIEEANKVHNSKYDYSETVYVKALDKVKIICPEHGVFEQQAISHLLGQGCPKCIKNRKKTKEEFILESTKTHNGKYSYDKVDFVNMSTKVVITCPIHGDFLQRPSEHIKGRGCSQCSGYGPFPEEEFFKRAKEKFGDTYKYGRYKGISRPIEITCPIHGTYIQTARLHLVSTGCPKCAKSHKKTKEEFLEIANEVHKGRYDYSKVDFYNMRKKVEIICPEHGSFWQQPSEHAKGQGCPKCGGTAKKTIEEFIAQASKIHNNKYSYDKTVYADSSQKVIITCPVHGDFEQRASDHLRGCGCWECTGKKKKTKEEFVELASKKFDNKYDYSKADYKNMHEKIEIVCPIHGSFWQVPQTHLLSKTGCPKCGGTGKTTLEEFIEKAEKVHGKGTYDYSKVDYKNTSTKVEIICPKHGSFWQRPNNHTDTQQGCPKCAGNRRLTKEEFIERSREIHEVAYDYSKVNYVNQNTPVEIICPVHGSFLQRPENHMRGHGCPKCGYNIPSNVSRGFLKVKQWLEDNNIEFEEEKTFEDLLYKRSLRFDFYLPSYNLLIEYQGRQHFEPIEYFGGEEALASQKERDNLKREYCQTNNIQLIEIPYLDNIERKLTSIIEDLNK